MELIKWDIYEISSNKSELTGVKLRGRIRKYGLVNEKNILAENTDDIEGRVRFAVPHKGNVLDIEEFLRGIVPDVKLERKMEGVKNPVLSKLKVNLEERYQI